MPARAYLRFFGVVVFLLMAIPPAAWAGGDQAASNPPKVITGFSVPATYIALAMSLEMVPMLWGLARACRSRSKLVAGLCITCGYDLRATPSRCPECGTVPRVLPAPR